MKVPTFLRNYEKVLDFFGYWPSFHDAKVASYTRANAGHEIVNLTLHTWEMTSEVDAKGYFVLRKHVVIAFYFADVHDIALEPIASGNILFDMSIARDNEADSFVVNLNSVMDISVSFAARSGEVVSVLPCTNDGKPI
jgi:hypothetical protein